MIELGKVNEPWIQRVSIFDFFESLEDAQHEQEKLRISNRARCCVLSHSRVGIGRKLLHGADLPSSLSSHRRAWSSSVCVEGDVFTRPARATSSRD